MASAETTKIRNKLANLSESLDNLETLLEPLLSQSLAETLVNLEPLQQAKLQTLLPYAVYDLVFMYLKLEGIDPKTHPVIAELDRIRVYFDKISHTENPPTRKTEIDKEAAGRFIKNAIAQVWKRTAAEEAQDEPPAAASSSKAIPTKITAKMFERQQYEADLKKQDAEQAEAEEDILEIIDDEANVEENSSMDVDEPKPVAEVKEPRRSGRNRPTVDPFSGYGDDLETSQKRNSPSSSSAPDPSATKASKPKRKTAPDASKKKKKSKATS